MGTKIQVRRGLKVDLPILDVGEMGHCIDTNEFFIGTATGNEQLTFDKTKYDSYDQQIESLTSSLADIVKRLKFVTYEMFGAKLDGVTDDTEAIKACHDYANSNNYKVVQNSGTIFITDKVVVKTSTDLSGCKLILNHSLQNGKTLYSIESDNPEITITDYVQSEFTKGSAIFPSLKNYKNYYITIDSDQLACVRFDGANQSNTYKKDSLVLNTRDGLSTVPLIHDLTTGVLTVKGRKLDTKPLIFKGLNIEWNFQNLNYRCTAVDIRRSNVKFKDINFHVTNDIDYNDTTVSMATVFSIQYCSNITMDNVVSENAREGTSGSAYIFYVERVVNLNVNNTNLLNGWHAFGTNGVKNWNVRDSIVNGLDVHFGAGDIYCDNVKFLGNWGFLLGYGDGKVIIDNCVSEVRAVDTKAMNSLVWLQNSYGYSYEGEIIIRNHTIVNPNWGFFLVRREGAANDYKISNDIKLPDLYVDKVFIRNQIVGGNRIEGYAIEGLANYETTLVNNNKKMIMPRNVEIKNVRFENPNDEAEFRAIKIEFDSTTSLDTKIMGEMKVLLDNIKQGIYSKFKNGFSTGDTVTTMKSVIHYISQSAATSLFKLYITVKNCDGKVRAEGITEKIVITNSEITDCDFQYGSGALVCKDVLIKDCTIYYGGYAGATRAQVMNSVIIDSIIFPYKLDGVYQAFQELVPGGAIKRLSGNVFMDTAVSDATANKWWKYVNSAAYKLPTTL